MQVAFSLIVPTYGRTDDLAMLFSTLNRQLQHQLEVIVVDQNDDDRVAPYLGLLSPDIRVHHVRVRKKSLSNARNVGMAEASGEIIAFPDDDCWYPDGLLSRVAIWFATHPGYDILAVGAQDEEGLPSGNRWPQDQCDIRPYNSLRTTFSNSLFLKRASLPRRVVFDEKMLASEETDYILHLLTLGLRGRFDRSLHICHPRRDMLSGTISSARAKRYGQGMGQLARRHSLYALWAGLMAYEVFRAAIVALSGDLHGAKFCLAHAQGIVFGFLSPAPCPASTGSLQAE